MLPEDNFSKFCHDNMWFKMSINDCNGYQNKNLD